MTVDLIRIRNERATELSALLDRVEREARAWTAEERDERNRLVTILGELDADIEALRTARAVAETAPDPLVQRTQQAAAQDRHEQTAGERALHASADYQQAFSRYMGSGEDHELRALGAAAGSEGGYLVPTVVYDQIFNAVAKEAPFVRLVKRIASTDAAINLPTLASAGSFAYVTQGNAPSDSDPALGQVPLGTFVAQRVIGVDFSLQNSTVDVDAWLRGLFAESLADFLEGEVIKGAGSTSAIQGVLVGGTAAKTTASATAIARDEIMAVYWAMPAKYLGRAVWVMAPSTAKKIDEIANSVTGDTLWKPALADGFQWSINGNPVVISDGAPANAANTTVAAFVNPGSYVLKDGGLEVAVSEHANFTKRQLTYRAVWRGDGDLIAATHAQCLKMKAS